MSETWFISDTHFGHANILEYERKARPFENLSEMHEAIIERWNNVVHKFDKVFHLGDFCFGRDNVSIAARLNGQKRLIMGNHDVYSAAEYLTYFHSIHGVMYWNKCVLSHIPLHTSMMDTRTLVNIHGHLHSKTMNDERYFNVSCERNNLTPINADEIWRKINGNRG